MSLASQFFRRGGQALCRAKPSATSHSSTVATAPAYSHSLPLRSDLHAQIPFCCQPSMLRAIAPILAMAKTFQDPGLAPRLLESGSAGTTQ